MHLIEPMYKASTDVKGGIWNFFPPKIWRLKKLIYKILSQMDEKERKDDFDWCNPPQSLNGLASNQFRLFFVFLKKKERLGFIFNNFPTTQAGWLRGIWRLFCRIGNHGSTKLCKGLYLKLLHFEISHDNILSHGYSLETSSLKKLLITMDN